MVHDRRETGKQDLLQDVLGAWKRSRVSVYAHPWPISGITPLWATSWFRNTPFYEWKAPQHSQRDVIPLLGCLSHTAEITSFSYRHDWTTFWPFRNSKSFRATFHDFHLGKRAFSSCFWYGSTENLERMFFFISDEKRNMKLSWLMAVMLSFGETHADQATRVFYLLSVKNFELEIWADLHDQTNRWLKSLCIRLRMVENFLFFLTSQNRSRFVSLFSNILKSGFFLKVLLCWIVSKKVLKNKPIGAKLSRCLRTKTGSSVMTELPLKDTARN